MKIRRTRFVSPLGVFLLSLACPRKATSHIDARVDPHAVRDFSHNTARNEAHLAATVDACLGPVKSATFPDAIRQFADDESEVRSYISARKIGPSQGGRTNSRILANGAVSARACTQQTCRSDARTGHSSRATFNRSPAADPWSRQRAI